MNEKLKLKLKKIKNPKFIFILGISGILLIGLSSFFGDGNKANDKNSFGENNAEVYCEALEEKVKDLVFAVTGDRKATVAITLESGIKYTYADDTKTSLSEKNGETTNDKSDESENKYIVVRNSDGSETALLISEKMPEVRGVTVVCSPINCSKQDIEDAVKAMLGITSQRICVLIK